MAESTPLYYDDGSGPSIIGLVNMMLRHLRLLVGLPLVGFTGGVVVSLLSDTVYTAESTLMPQVSQASASRIAGLASQIGIDVGASAAGGESLDFYGEVLRSRELLRGTVTTTYLLSDSNAVQSVPLTLVQAYGIEQGTEEQMLRRAMRRLREDVVINVDPKTGLIRLATTAPDQHLAVQINRRMLELLNDFNLETRKSQAAAERAFIGARLEEARRELETAEVELEQFLSRNRRYQESPQLTFAASRLQRRVELRQQVHTSLAQAYEQARIEEVRNTPIVTVVDRPEGSVIATGGGLWGAPVLLSLLGAFLALGVVMLHEAFTAQRTGNPDEYQTFLALRRAAVHDLTPKRLLSSARSTARNGR